MNDHIDKCIDEDCIIYTCKISDSFISVSHYISPFVKDKKSIIMVDNYFLPENINLYIILLKNCIEDLINAKYNYFIQNINFDDIDYFKTINVEWDILELNDFYGYAKVGCNISKALDNIIDGLGILFNSNT
jgi:hypothetical protein